MSTIASTAALLAEVFPGTRVSRPDYLAWLYEESPFGVAIEANLDDELGRAGHYAIVPVTLVQDGAALDGALSLNTAVHERARGRGTFVRLAEETYTQARLRGIRMVLGVGNANSTHGLVHRLGFEFVTALPATILLPIPGPRIEVRSAWAEAAAFARGGIAADLMPLLVPPTRGIARIWTPETIRWRLGDPGMRYGLHRTADALAVSCRDQRHGVGVALLLKVFAAAKISPMTCRALVRAVCRFHRAPVALHVGLNDLAGFRGFSLPKRIRERPLNLVYKSLDGEPRRSPIACFEFLDFDAY
jgi:GNAT superfamily N-acetyltransferase